MIKALLEGIVWGLVLSMMLGPVFFGLIHTSIHKGFKKALLYASGVACSDAFFIAITYFGVAGFMEEPDFQKFMTIVGGVIMIAFGIYYLLKKAPDSIQLENQKKQPSKSNMWIKGFILNGINPSVFLFWIGMVGYVTTTYENSQSHVFVFFLFSILTVFSADTLKAFIAHKIKIYFTVKVLNKMNKVLGAMILLAGVSLLYNFFTETQ